MRDAPIRWYSGVPPVEAFGTVDGKGTPIVIDTGTDTAYYLAPDNTVRPLAGGGSGTIGYEDGMWNRLDLSGTWTLSNFHKTTQWNSGAAVSNCYANQGRATGKRYFEVDISGIHNGYPTSVAEDIGIARPFPQGSAGSSMPADGACYRASGVLVFATVISPAVPTLTTGDVVSVAVDLGAGKTWFAKNGTWTQGDPAAGTGQPGTVPLGGLYFPVVAVETGGSSVMNVTLRVIEADFSYPLPSGFLPWGAY